MFFGFLLEEVGFQRFQVTPKLSFGDGAWRAEWRRTETEIEGDQLVWVYTKTAVRYVGLE